MWCDVTWHIVGPNVVSDYYFTSYEIVARSVTAVCRYFARMFLSISLLDIDNGKVFLLYEDGCQWFICNKQTCSITCSISNWELVFLFFKEIIYKLHVLNLRQTSVWQYCGNNVSWRIILAVDVAVAVTVSILIYFFCLYSDSDTASDVTSMFAPAPSSLAQIEGSKLDLSIDCGCVWLPQPHMHADIVCTQGGEYLIGMA